MTDDLNHMIETVDGKQLYCPDCGPGRKIGKHIHSFDVKNLLVDQCVIEGCHEQRYA